MRHWKGVLSGWRKTYFCCALDASATTSLKFIRILNGLLQGRLRAFLSFVSPGSTHRDLATKAVSRQPLFIVGWLLAAELVAAPCFDFTKKNSEPLRALIALNPKIDVSATGEGKNGVQWGAVRGTVKHHIVDLLKRFDDPYLTKNRKNTVITSVVSKASHYLWVRKMNLVVKPVFFVTVEWDEQWAMAMREGTPLQPKSLIVYYQKVAGTSHLEHLCGNIVVNFIDAKTSDVYLYEEVKAAHWSNEDAVKNFLVVLKIFRGEHKDD